MQSHTGESSGTVHSVGVTAKPPWQAELRAYLKQMIFRIRIQH